MGVNTLNNRSSGETITANFFNDIHQALDGDMVGRNTSGVPTPGQNLGTVALPWGNVYADQMILNGTAVDPTQITIPANIVISGKTRSTSNQPAFIVPSGSGGSFTVDGTPTNLAMLINGTAASITTDVVKSGLTLAPSSNNTALVNDALAADQEDTKQWGEPWHWKEITIDNIGSNISALDGKWAAFKLAGTSTEYFLALVDTTNNKLTKCFRGYFYNPSLQPIKRAGFSDNDTITLMKLVWVFADADGSTIDVSYTNPVWDYTSPSSPAAGDYWYDQKNETWKRYDGASFVIIDRTFIGMVVCDATDCVAARCVDFYSNPQDTNTMALEKQTTEKVRMSKVGAKVSVMGNLFEYPNHLLTWNITTDLAGADDMYNATEQSSTMYYLYLSDEGETIISDISPYHRLDLRGAYHPYNPWRCVGLAYNDGSSDFEAANGTSNLEDKSESYYLGANQYGSTDSTVRDIGTTKVKQTGVSVYPKLSGTLGTQLICYWPGSYSIMYQECRTTGPSNFRLTKNNTNLTVGVSGDVDANRVLNFLNPDTNFQISQSTTLELKVGDVIRMQGEGGTAEATSTEKVGFRVYRVS